MTPTQTSSAALTRWPITWLCMALCVGLMLWTGAHLVPGFDEFWHIWYAETDSWEVFWADLSFDSHPPLSYLLLRLWTSSGDSVWMARAMSMLAALMSIPVFASCAYRLGAAPWTAATCTLVFACSAPFIELGTCVRSYSLAMLFQLVAMQLCLGAWLRPSSIGRLQLWGLGAAVTLGIWSLYTTALPLAGLAAGILWMGAMQPEQRRQVSAALRKLRPWPQFLLVGAAAVGLLVWFKSCMRASVHHWTGAYLPQPEEGAGAYLLRGLNLNLSHFSALDLDPTSLWGPAVLAALILLGVLGNRHQTPTGGLGILLVTLLGTLFLLFLAGLQNHHPFGGKVRHQFLLFPLLLLAMGTAVQELLQRLRPTCLRVAGAALGLAAGLFFVVDGHLGPPIDEGGQEIPMAGTYALLGSRLGPGDGVFAGTFGFIGLYANARAEEGFAWQRSPRVADRHIDAFAARLAGQRSLVLRDRNYREVGLRLEPTQADFVHSLMEEFGLQTLWFLEQGQARDAATATMARRAIEQDCHSHGLRTECIQVPGQPWIWRLHRDR